MCIRECSNYGSIRFIGYLDSGQNAFKYFQTTGTTPLQAGKWHHIVWSQAGSTDYIFVDGVSQSVTRAEIPSFNLVDGDWGINALGPTGFSYNEDCQVDEVRLSNVTRYTSNFTPSTTPFTTDANTKLLIQSDFSEGGIGADHSGNYNYFTPTNLSAHDMMPDSPMNNFATINPLIKTYVTSTMSEGNLRMTGGSGWNAYVSTIGVSSGKWYWEIIPGTTNFRAFVIGDQTSKWWDGTINPLSATDGEVGYVSDGDKTIDNVNTSYGASYSAGVIIGVALDLSLIHI